MKRTADSWVIEAEAILKETGVETRVSWSVDVGDGEHITVYMTPDQADRLAAELLLCSAEIQFPQPAPEKPSFWAKWGLWILGLAILAGPFIDGSL